MSDLQPSHLPPAPADASHAQVIRSSADDHIDVGQRLADEQIDQRPSADEQSEEKSSYKWIHENYREKRICRPWWDARFQGTLPLALSARIPLEVFEFIVDEMNQHTLIAAALVCLAWYPRAMRKLYHTVEIRGRTSFNRLFKQCHASPRVKQWLASTCKLVAVGRWNDLPILDDVSDSEQDTEDASVESPQLRNTSNTDNHDHFLQALPFALAGLMPRVRTLHIEQGELRFIRPDFFFALSKFESVKSLTLDVCELNNITQLRRIVSAFPQLTDLKMVVVGFAQRGAASYAGASLSRAPSHIRLRCLEVDVHNEPMMMFLDWMSRSDLCASLAKVTILSRYALTHENLLQNTALQFLDFKLRDIEHIMAEDEGPRAAWTEATRELHGIFSTIRSRQLEHIEVHVRVYVDDSILESEEPSAVLEKLDLRGLHEVMSQPYFDTLKDVEVKMTMWPRTDQTESDVDNIGQKLEDVFHGLLRPWSDRGIVDTSCVWRDDGRRQWSR
ncbi:uncharacterized protein B0H18DRAFT_1121229 [Fomitopsis serialis]|uniref:uncharacterized protein n=1 Tax=Fomitopsis serialis TaxID=139415 RepID=UPI002007E33E|nr:uncharacterized protein B0H18DRAFT_1121229 [Neoantrodia serialis]KAH9921767.1 hypothetical protein B0H18DRAFT_1121229 [Neoantrodia serialis]